MPHLCRFLALAVIPLITACSAYGPASWVSKTGYREERMRRDLYQVHYQGDETIADDRLKDFAWLRAAELCLEKGFTHFEIVTRLPENGADFTVNVGASSRDLSGQSSRTVTFTDTAPAYHLIVRFHTAPVSASAIDARGFIEEARRKHHL